MSKPHVVILGAGPAGLGAAYRLTRDGLAKVTVLENGDQVGGNAASFEIGGLRVDYGSHRLHPSCDAPILRDIRTLLGDDLLDRPRHGRIRLCGRWVHFPLKPFDLALGLSPGFTFGVSFDLLRKAFKLENRIHNDKTFASVLEGGLGRTICRDFYFPYAEKIWGVDAEDLSAKQAERRVSASSVGKLMGKVLSASQRSNREGRGRFYYPRLGFGQIAAAYAQAAIRAGGDIRLSCQILSLEMKGGGVNSLHYQENGERRSLCPDLLWSTIPITSLARYLEPGPPPEYRMAMERTSYRSMALVYLVLPVDRFSEYDAHYFPEREIPISRLSEPKNYSDGEGPSGRTVLCAELPCATDDPSWIMSDQELGQLVCRSLEISGIPLKVTPSEVVTRRIEHAYPIYRQGYEIYFDQLDRFFSGIEGILTFGRQGLFAHDNAHHALSMGYAAAACLGANGRFDDKRWQEFRRVFETHVVED